MYCRVAWTASAVPHASCLMPCWRCVEDGMRGIGIKSPGERRTGTAPVHTYSTYSTCICKGEHCVQAIRFTRHLFISPISSPFHRFFETKRHLLFLLPLGWSTQEPFMSRFQQLFRSCPNFVARPPSPSHSRFSFASLLTFMELNMSLLASHVIPIMRRLEEMNL